MIRMMIGQSIGNYRITEKIGEGGMGAVYVAEHSALGRKAAVKVLLPEHSQRADLVQRFFNEARTAAKLNHPALVDVFDFGQLPDGSAYLVMDFLEGESLANRLERLGPLPVEQAADLARQIAAGMAAAHGHGIIHRDLKPDNVFVVRDPEDPTRERVKIIDFGIAKLVGNEGGPKKGGATSTGMVLGTPLFMAPEQCRGAGVVDLRADIYALGCIVFMMLTGRPPFPYEGVGEILGAHLHEPVPAPRSLNPAIPAALEAIVLRCLAKRADERFANMSELGNGIAQAMGWPAGGRSGTTIPGAPAQGAETARMGSIPTPVASIAPRSDAATTAATIAHAPGELPRPGSGTVAPTTLSSTASEMLPAASAALANVASESALELAAEAGLPRRGIKPAVLIGIGVVAVAAIAVIAFSIGLQRSDHATVLGAPPGAPAVATPPPATPAAEEPAAPGALPGSPRRPDRPGAAAPKGKPTPGKPGTTGLAPPPVAVPEGVAPTTVAPPPAEAVPAAPVPQEPAAPTPPPQEPPPAPPAQEPPPPPQEPAPAPAPAEPDPAPAAN